MPLIEMSVGVEEGRTLGFQGAKSNVNFKITLDAPLELDEKGKQELFDKFSEWREVARDLCQWDVNEWSRSLGVDPVAHLESVKMKVNKELALSNGHKE